MSDMITPIPDVYDPSQTIEREGLMESLSLLFRDAPNFFDLSLETYVDEEGAPHFLSKGEHRK